MHPPRLIADRYSLVEPLGGSATDTSWHARDQWSGQLVLVTRVPMSGLVGQELLGARHEIADEVRALGDLQHDRLARAIDVVLDADDLWVASETLPGVTLAEELARLGAVRPERVARWGRDVADGLVVAHGAGVQHRNLHAGVVGIADDGGAVIGGFANTVVTPDGVRSGTPVHVAPEVARGACPSPAADIFALGTMLYIAVEGHGPFPAAEDREQLLAAVTAGAVVTPQRAGQLSGPLMRMLHPDPAQRPAATVVADQLRQLTAIPGCEYPATIRVTSSGPAFDDPPSYRDPLPWGAPPLASGNPQPLDPELPPAATDPSAGQRMWWVVAAALVAVLALAGGLLVAFGPSGLTGRPAAARALPPPIGDPRTADPCSLLSVGSARQFGPATMVRDIGLAHECGIHIATSGEDYLWLGAAFGSAADPAPTGVAERLGQLTISREAASDRHCLRTIVLADRSRVYVKAEAYQEATEDLCAIADVGTQTAVAALSSGNLPRRGTSDPPNALTSLDTCSLLDQAVLEQVPGLDAARRDAGFAGWLCTWGRNPAFLDEPQVSVAVLRSWPLPGQPVRIGGRSAQVTPGGRDNEPGSCMVQLVQRSYTETSGGPGVDPSRVEALLVSVFLGAQQPNDVACNSARALAETAAPKLPTGA